MNEPLPHSEQAPPSQPGAIRVLLVEDNPGDAVLLREMLLAADSTRFELIAADSLAGAGAVLDTGLVDLVLLDLSLPDSRGLETFQRLNERAPMVPVVVLTGTDDEGLAIRAVQEGAQDYLVKGQVTGSLLVRAIRYAIERKRLLREIQEALASIKTLRGLLPICASCKRIRDDSGYWNQVEVYVMQHSEADFTHSICPECAVRLYPELYGRNPRGPGRRIE